MDRDHKIRLAVASLPHGPRREYMIDRLLKNPEALNREMGKRVGRWSTSRKGLRARTAKVRAQEVKPELQAWEQPNGNSGNSSGGRGRRWRAKASSSSSRG